MNQLKKSLIAFLFSAATMAAQASVQNSPNDGLPFVPSMGEFSGNLEKGVSADTISKHSPVLIKISPASENTGASLNAHNINSCVAFGEGTADFNRKRVYIDISWVSCESYDGRLYESSARGYAVDIDGNVGLKGQLIELDEATNEKLESPLIAIYPGSSISVVSVPAISLKLVGSLNPPYAKGKHLVRAPKGTNKSKSSGASVDLTPPSYETLGLSSSHSTNGDHCVQKMSDETVESSEIALRRNATLELKKQLDVDATNASNTLLSKFSYQLQGK